MINKHLVALRTNLPCSSQSHVAMDASSASSAVEGLQTHSTLAASVSVMNPGASCVWCNACLNSIDLASSEFERGGGGSVRPIARDRR
jgi:hypothetical protein